MPHIPHDRDTRYRVIRFAGRPVLAIPVERLHLRLACISRYQPSTPRRALFRLAVYLSALTGFDRLFGTSQRNPLLQGVEFGLQDWLSDVSRALQRPGAVACAIWPPQPERRRLYLHLMSPEGHAIAFCKLALDEVNDRSLHHEMDALAEVAKIKSNVIRTPKILHQRFFNGHSYIAYEPLPSYRRARMPTWSELSSVVQEFAGGVRRIDETEVRALEWWRQFMIVREHCDAHFLREVDAAVSSGVDVCRAHGDFTPSNIFHVDSQIWICDWEFSSPSAPRRTDDVAYHLARQYRLCVSRPATALRDLVRRAEADGTGEVKQEIALALAFHCGYGNQPAMSLASQWKSIET